MNGSLWLLAAESIPQSASIFHAASPPAELIRTLSILIFAVSGLIFLIVEGVLIYSLLRFRRARMPGGSGTRSRPRSMAACRSRSLGLRPRC